MSPPSGAVRAAACDHCGEPLPPGAPPGPAPRFCCRGCAAVWSALHDAGLQDYYRLRERLPPGPVETTRDDALDAFDAPEISRRSCRLEDAPGGPRLVATFAVSGMHCASCGWVIEEVLRGEAGVVEARASLAEERVRVELDPALADAPPLARLARALSRIGYGARPVREGEPAAGEDGREGRRELLRLGVAAGGAMNLMLAAISLYAGDHTGMEAGHRELFRWTSLGIATPVVFYSAGPILARAAGAVRRGMVHVDVPLALAIGAMYGSSAAATLTGRGEIWFDSLGMLVALLLGGRAVESAVRRRAGRRLASLLHREAAPAWRVTDSGTVPVPADLLVPGDRIALSPGDVVPVDAVVESGTSEVDFSVVDGESRPIPCAAGAALPAGARILTGGLRARVERAAADSTLAAIRSRVAAILSRRTPVERAADRIARTFVVAMVGVAALTALAWWWVDPSRALPVTAAVLVVACPCALALATPLSFAAAVHGAAAAGLLVRDGGRLLDLGRISAVAFDKTGTLTDGVLRPLSLDLTDAGRDLGEARLLALAAAACGPSRHPVSRAVVRAAAARGAGRPPLAVDFREVPGEGVRARVEGHEVRVHRPGASVSVDGILAGRLDLRDQPRTGAAAAVAALGSLGIRTVLLSGDGEARALDLGRALGMDEVRGGMSKEDKALWIARARAGGARIAFVGDGLNDAEALAGADVGLAVDEGVGLAVEAAAGTVRATRPEAVGEGVVLGRALARVLRQNFALSAAYNALAVAAAAAGLVSPLLAAVLMPGSSLAVVLNSARLARGRSRRPRGGR
ncbi:heavy metal translocating P-type ATPase [Myxococcota bacterium]|nr:heavy metal translocating P-type ATPase [Myxococcota bacterium]